MSGHPQWCFLRPALGVIAWLDPGFDDGRSYEWIDVVCSMWCQTWLVFPTGTFSVHALSQKWSVYLNELLYIENIHGPHWMNRTFPLSQPAGETLDVTCSFCRSGRVSLRTKQSLSLAFISCCLYAVVEKSVYGRLSTDTTRLKKERPDKAGT